MKKKVLLILLPLLAFSLSSCVGDKNSGDSQDKTAYPILVNEDSANSAN